MELFEYRADILPQITLSGLQASNQPFQNIRRISGDYIFYLVTQGDVYLMEDNVFYHLQKGDCLLLEPGKLHFGTQPSNYRLYYIHFRHPDVRKRTVDNRQWAQSIRSEHSAWRASLENGPFPGDRIAICKHIRIDVSAVSSMIERMMTLKHVHLEHCNTLCSCAASEIFIEIQRQYTAALIQTSNRGMQSAARVNAVVLYLHANYKHKITSAMIEQELSYNFDYLNQLFCRHLHISIFKMLEQIRMEAAKNILLTQGLTIKQTASEVGYSDEAYFSRVFKQHTGITPAKYRKEGTRPVV